MRRVRVFLGHLGISAVVVTALVLLFIFLWFPMPYFMTDGGWRALRLVACVDIVAGPLLTLVAANPNKPKRAFAKDLAVIALLQCTAMGLGLWTIYNQRTEAVIFVDGTFIPVETAQTELFGDTYRNIAAASSKRPVYIVSDLPDELNERQKIRQQALKSGKPIYLSEQYFVPLDEGARAELLATVTPPYKLLADTPEARAQVDEFVKSLGGAPEDHLLFPVISRYEKFLLALSRRDLTVEGWKRGLPFKYR
jgi:hypothetical protein